MSFSVWVTGPEIDAAEAVADELARGLAARDVAVEVLDRRTPGIDALAGDDIAARAAFVARALAGHGVATIVALPVPQRAARDAVRARLAAMLEVYVRSGDEAPTAAYEPPDRAEVEGTVPVDSPAALAARTLRTLEVLAHLEHREDPGYSDEDERQVIRRLKAYGYL